ncbi:MAG: O-antigen ligase family protein [Acidimicrobiales bacterium]
MSTTEDTSTKKVKRRVPVELWVALVVAAIASYGSTTVTGGHSGHRAGGGTSISSVYTLIFAVIVVFASLRYVLQDRPGAGRSRTPKLLVLFLFWAALTLVWGLRNKEAGQELCVFITFVGIMAGMAALAPKDAIRTVVRILTPISWVLSLLFLSLIAVKGLGEAKSIGATRGYAIEACLLTASAMVGWRILKMRWTKPLCVLVPLTVLLSLSRTATVAVICVLTIGYAMTSPKKPKIYKVVIGLIVGLGSVALLVDYWPPLRDRFSGGDNGHLLGVSINTEGRARAWSLLWHSATGSWTHFLFGQGVGSATTFTKTYVGPAFPQPHNDYLRLLFDEGIVGFCLFVGAMLWLLIRAYRGARRRDLSVDASASHVAAFLALMVLLIMMTTDNPIVYPFVMYPAACFIGLSLANGTRRRRRATSSSPIVVKDGVVMRRTEPNSLT